MLYSTPMVQAVLEKRKRVTRRTYGLQNINIEPDKWKFDDFKYTRSSKGNFQVARFVDSLGHVELIKNPFGLYGDILWVRETYSLHGRPDISKTKYIYKSDKSENVAEIIRWRASIHMPREACQLFLIRKDVRLERLQDITEDSAISEGVKRTQRGNYLNYQDERSEVTQFIYNCATAKHSFRTLWDELNGNKFEDRFTRWASNPWVWVVEFTVCENPPVPPYEKKAKI